MKASIVIPTYNAAAFVSKAIGSVQRQDLGDLEIILVDDGSTDATVPVMEKLAEADPRIRLLRLPDNQGPAAARNAGFQAACGEWIAVLDADDSWKPERLSSLIPIAEQWNVDFIADNQILCSPDDGQPVRTGFRSSRAIRELDLSSLLRYDRPGRSFTYGWLKPIIRRTFWQQSGVRYNPAIRYGEDFHFYAELLFHGAKAVIYCEPYYYYTLRTARGGASSNLSRTTPSFEQVARSSDLLLQTYGPQMTPHLRRLIATRRSRVVAWPATRKLKELVASGDWTAAAALVRSRPTSLFHLVWIALDRLTERTPRPSFQFNPHR